MTNRAERRRRGLAARKAHHARATSEAAAAWAAGSAVMAVVCGEVTFWALADSVVITPTLPADAPPVVRDRQESWVVAALTGACPDCGAVASVQSAARVVIDHEPGCGLDYDPGEGAR